LVLLDRSLEQFALAPGAAERRDQIDLHGPGSRQT
jgi:hypothetical protein